MHTETHTYTHKHTYTHSNPNTYTLKHTHTHTNTHTHESVRKTIPSIDAVDIEKLSKRFINIWESVKNMSF